MTRQNMECVTGLMSIQVDIKHFRRATLHKTSLLFKCKAFHQIFVDMNLGSIHEGHRGCRGPLGMIFTNSFPCNGSEPKLLATTQLHDNNSSACRNIRIQIQLHFFIFGFKKKTFLYTRITRKVLISHSRNQKRTPKEPVGKQE